jgi:hypothetical protein
MAEMVLKWSWNRDIMTSPDQMASYKVVLFSNTNYNDQNLPKTLVQKPFVSLADAVLYTALLQTCYHFKPPPMHTRTLLYQSVFHSFFENIH